MLAALVALALLAGLPSALNLPQANPAETLEYAPVPPEESDEDTTPPAGNFSSLGLGGRGRSFGGGPVESDSGDSSATAGGRAIKTASTKRCVGDPPRQTEDPLAPPCVGYFDGKNFGSTYQGVTPVEVRVLLFVNYDGYSELGSEGFKDTPPQGFYDLAQPPEGDEVYSVRAARLWQRYFNDRYQTYGRFVHFFVAFAPSGYDVESYRAAAGEHFRRVKPFAVIVTGSESFQEAYLEEMARRGVMNFGGRGQRPSATFAAHAGLIWSYNASIELAARKFVAFVCAKVVPFPVSFGNPAMVGSPRKLGLLHAEDGPEGPSAFKFAMAAKRGIERCGGHFAAEAAFEEGATLAAYGYDHGRGLANMSKFQELGVTTVIWAQGYEDLHTAAATQLRYHPEWVLAGDESHEDMLSARLQSQEQWANVWVASELAFEDLPERDPCFQAARETEPQFSRQDKVVACEQYRHFRQLFTGIQVAGPRLTPSSVEKGFRAIPSIATTDPKVPSCFYQPGDYTCNKDATRMWWDPTARSPHSSGQGCWRAAEGAQRFLPEDWTREDVAARRRPDDPCTAYVRPNSVDA